MADVPEHFSDTPQEKSEANHVQIIASQGNVTRESSSTDTDSEPVNKCSQQNLIFTSFKKLQLKKFTIFVCIEIR